MYVLRIHFVNDHALFFTLVLQCSLSKKYANIHLLIYLFTLVSSLP